MDGEKTITASNGFPPITTSTVNEEYTAAMALIHKTTPSSRHRLEEQDEHVETRSRLNFETPGPGTLLFCLVLNMLVTISWYYLNIDISFSGRVIPTSLYRYLYDGLVLAPMGLFSLFEYDRALCIARVALGGMLGASVIVKYGLGAGIFDGCAWVQLCFWAATGVLPGAGAVALVGFCWDCLYWGCESEEERAVDEKLPLLEKEDV
ncbi:hypothetical protein E4T50_16868 [Aureobasidium sp. EXF-12298]|nr:hypothetical protein E4T50_16868 [Aureobasidium sp. EXF-12298]KAI4750311.1 hypothetical protein E4T51_16360 [Aureobasidium sp. EXF-12344]KAI4767748.1 hypothetical protein E4T52_17116 [Aureobasidium sp. EXF-3400]